jgi:hypothetical protein
MNVTLTPDQEAWLRAEIAKARFATPEHASSYAINEAKRTALRDTLNVLDCAGRDQQRERRAPRRCRPSQDSLVGAQASLP